MKLLVVIVVILAVAAIAQAVRVYELAKGLSDEQEEDVNISDNNFNANMWLVVLFALLGSFFYLVFRYKDAMLPEAASLHGVKIDELFAANLWLVCGVFVIMNILLMVFAWKYRYQKDRKAFYYPHNNKLEMIWTAVPAAVMAIVIVYGLMVWNDITMTEKSDDAIVVQLYSQQFAWSARYAGADNELGASSFNFITASNPLGIISKEGYDQSLADIEKAIESSKDRLANEIMHEDVAEEEEEKLKRLTRHKVRILGFDRTADYSNADDDIYMDKGVFYLPVNREVEFAINSRDVIHSAFMPHFRMQMNAVPGMTTRFNMTPTITTEQMKAKTGNEDFDYILLCNKICGAAHYNMKMTVKVVEQDEYDAWLAEQKTFASKE
jgi:cytochrome c oxidase subunit 2